MTSFPASMSSISCQDDGALSVTALSQALKNHVEGRFSSLKVRGEVSGAKLHTSGHLYFFLKDAQTTLAAVSWRGTVARFPVQLQDGMEVICKGRLTTYPLQSKYQLVVEGVELAGQGSLLKMLEDLKRTLEAEGLFKEEHKKPLPLLPRLIGMITSPTGAVIQDMLHRLRDRCPVPVLLWPVLVQGPEAALQIVTAIQGFNALAPHGPHPRPDLLIIARGGGSLEDLWPFNEESVVRAVAQSTIPIISGVGHEPDVTLIDYAADHRAPTPTASIERAVPVRAQLLQVLQTLKKRGHLQLIRQWEDLSQRLDHVGRRLCYGLETLFNYNQARLKTLSIGLKHPKDFLHLIEMRSGNLFESLKQAGERHLERKVTALMQASSLLESYSFHKTLKRGFTLVFNENNHVVMSATQAQQESSLSLTWHDGTIKVIPSF